MKRLDLLGFSFGVGIEGTCAPGGCRDTLEVTGFYDRVEEELRLVKDVLGIQRHIRFPIPWHRIELEKGSRDWSEIDRVLDKFCDLEMQIIADPLHHIPPPWFDRGFMDAEIVSRYPDFVQELHERRPEIRSYTPFNEPTATLQFSGLRGIWYPNLATHESYVRMLRNASLATAEAVRRLHRADPTIQIVHIDTCEDHKGTSPLSQTRADFLNSLRFVFDDLLLGRVDEDHNLYPYLVRNGFPVEELSSLEDAPVRIDIRGLNYYLLNEEELVGDGEAEEFGSASPEEVWGSNIAPSRKPRGLAAIARDYYDHLQLPIRFTETNIQGTIKDRLSWLKFWACQCVDAARSLPSGVVQGADYYPLSDCKGWFVLLQGDPNDWPWDPQGLFWCDEAGNRHESELTKWYAYLVAGGDPYELPEIEFSPDIADRLRGFQHLMPSASSLSYRET